MPGPWATASSPASRCGLLDLLHICEAILISHSAGGTVAVNVVLRHPVRVAALVLVDPAIYTLGGAPA